jgi:hypothetical protein
VYTFRAGFGGFAVRQVRITCDGFDSKRSFAGQTFSGGKNYLGGAIGQSIVKGNLPAAKVEFQAE